jgi:hypothetical protein
MPHHQHYFSVDTKDGKALGLQADKSNYKQIAGMLENFAGLPIQVSDEDTHYLNGFNLQSRPSKRTRNNRKRERGRNYCNGFACSRVADVRADPGVTDSLVAVLGDARRSGAPRKFFGRTGGVIFLPQPVERTAAVRQFHDAQFRASLGQIL